MVISLSSRLRYCLQQSLGEQLQREQSHSERSLSSPGPEALRAWRLFFESALALVDLLGTELEEEVGIPMRWYDVLVQLEESPEGIPMNELADRILYSKSGFTRVVDRMEEAGLVRRVRPEHDRRSILVVITKRGSDTPAGTTETESNDISRSTSPNTRSRRSPAPSKRSARTHAHFAPAASAASTNEA